MAEVVLRAAAPTLCIWTESAPGPVSIIIDQKSEDKSRISIENQFGISYLNRHLTVML